MSPTRQKLSRSSPVWLKSLPVVVRIKGGGQAVIALKRGCVGDNRNEAILDNGGTANRHSRPSITGWSRRINKTWKSQRAAWGEAVTFANSAILLSPWTYDELFTSWASRASRCRTRGVVLI